MRNQHMHVDVCFTHKPMWYCSPADSENLSVQLWMWQITHGCNSAKTQLTSMCLNIMWNINCKISGGFSSLWWRCITDRKNRGGEHGERRKGTERSWTWVCLHPHSRVSAAGEETGRDQQSAWISIIQSGLHLTSACFTFMHIGLCAVSYNQTRWRSVSFTHTFVQLKSQVVSAPTAQILQA